MTAVAHDKTPRKFQVAGKHLVCPICSNDTFWTRLTAMNTRGLTFFGLDWLNADAANFICDNCGHILWFMPREIHRESATPSPKPPPKRSKT